jgi:hypothetical protein
MLVLRYLFALLYHPLPSLTTETYTSFYYLALISQCVAVPVILAVVYHGRAINELIQHHSFNSLSDYQVANDH